MNGVHIHHVSRPHDPPLTTAWSDYFDVLDKGFVRLEGALASDLDVVNSARVSFDGRSRLHFLGCRAVISDEDCTCGDPATYKDNPPSELSKKDAGLVNMLVRDHHGTPTEHSFFRFEVKAPIFVMREWHRHRIGISINEQSGRYMQLAREFYIPHRDDIREQVGKPGAYEYVRIEDDDKAEQVQHDIRTACDFAFDEYEAMLEKGIAKEVARIVLPVNTYSTMWWSCNPRSLMAFLSLRNHGAAQVEIQRYASIMEDIATAIMPRTFDAFVQHGRVSP